MIQDVARVLTEHPDHGELTRRGLKYFEKFYKKGCTATPESLKVFSDRAKALFSSKDPVLEMEAYHFFFCLLEKNVSGGPQIVSSLLAESDASATPLRQKCEADLARALKDIDR